MKWLNNLFQRDDFFVQLDKNPDLYQIFFEKLVQVADVKLWCAFVLNPKLSFSEEGIKRIEEEEKNTLPILSESEEKGLSQVVLFVIYLQYATADPLFDQDAKKSYWVSVVRNRKPVDSFPHHNAIIHYLRQSKYLE